MTMTHSELKSELLKEFERGWSPYPKLGDFPHHGLMGEKQYVAVRDFIDKALDKIAHAAVGKVKGLREANRKETGSFKYDFVYDEILEYFK